MIHQKQGVPSFKNTWIANDSIYDQLKRNFSKKTQRIQNPHDTIKDTNNSKQSLRDFDKYLPKSLASLNLYDRLKPLIDSINGQDTIHKAQLYEIISDYQVYRDPEMIQSIVEHHIHNINLINWCKEVMRHTHDENAFLFCLLILSYRSDLCPVEDLLMVGSCEKYAFYATEAILRHDEGSEEHLFTIAKSTYGWGRIFAIDALKTTEKETVRLWLLEEGYYNDVDIQLTALLICKASKLLVRLKNQSLTPRALQATGCIIEHLARKGPVDGFEGYEKALEVIECYLLATIGRFDHIQHYMTYRALHGFLKAPHYDWSTLEGYGFTTQVRRSLIAQLEEQVANKTPWLEAVKNADDYHDDRYYETYSNFAEWFDVDIDKAHLHHLAKNPYDYQQWERVISSSLSIEEIATLANQYLGGEHLKEKDLEKHVNLVFDHLSLYEGYGVEIISQALQGERKSIRLLAIETLARWTISQRACLKKEIQQQLVNEKDPFVKAQLSVLLP